MTAINDNNSARDQIFFAAKREFAEKGFTGARMNTIARLAGVPQSLVHYHFGSKEELYNSILRNISTIFNPEGLKDFLDGLDINPAEKLFLSIYILSNTLSDNHEQDIDRLIAHEIASGMKYFTSYISESYIPTIKVIGDIIADGVKKGIFRTGLPYFVVLNIISFITACRQTRDFLYSSRNRDNIFNDVDSEIILNFVAEHTFRALSPGKPEPHVPAVNPEILEKADAFVLGLRKSFENLDIKPGSSQPEKEM